MREPTLEQLENEVVEEVLQYCSDSGRPPTPSVVAETIEVRREKSGPGKVQEMYTEVEERVRRRLQL
jgi:hypothetical protein